MDGKHRQKISARRQLLELIVDGIVENEDFQSVWKQYDYRFMFLSCRYFWNYLEIHVTASEALFLYRLLMLKDETCKEQSRYLRSLRRRLGEEFLTEVFK